MLNKYELHQALIRLGYLLPENNNVNYLTFAGLIKEHYSLCNPIIWKYYNLIVSLPANYRKKACKIEVNYY